MKNYRHRTILILLIIISSVFVFLQNGNAQSTKQVKKIPVPSTPWRTSFDIIDGWDWSLPPGIEAVPYSGKTMLWPLVDGKRWDLPGKELTKIVATWRELEPKEGEFDFAPLKERIQEAEKDWDGVILHIRASVWEITDFPAHENANYPPNWLPEQKIYNESAPRWLEKYDIEKLPGRPRYNIATPFQIFNCDVFDEDYHSRYIKFIEAFGKSGIPQMKIVFASYLHFASGSRGEEGEGLNRPEKPGDKEKMKERYIAWAKAFTGLMLEI